MNPTLDQLAAAIDALRGDLDALALRVKHIEGRLAVLEPAPVVRPRVTLRDALRHGASVVNHGHRSQGLATRVENCCRNHGITTLEALAATPASDLETWPNMGDKCRRTVCEALAHHGYEAVTP